MAWWWLCRRCCPAAPLARLPMPLHAYPFPLHFLHGQPPPFPPSHLPAAPFAALALLVRSLLTPPPSPSPPSPLDSHAGRVPRPVFPPFPLLALSASPLVGLVPSRLGQPSLAPRRAGLLGPPPSRPSPPLVAPPPPVSLPLSASRLLLQSPFACLSGRFYQLLCRGGLWLLPWLRVCVVVACPLCFLRQLLWGGVVLPVFAFLLFFPCWRVVAASDGVEVCD